MLRLAVELGQCNLNVWRSAQEQLNESPSTLNIEGLFEIWQGVNFLLKLFHGYSLHGAFPKSMKDRIQLTGLIERGYFRLAQVTALHQALIDISTDEREDGIEQRKYALDKLKGMMLGQLDNEPKLLMTYFSALGGVLCRARIFVDEVPQTLVKDIANLRLLPSGSLDLVPQNTIIATAKVAATVAIADALEEWKSDLPSQFVQHAAHLRDILIHNIRAYRNEHYTNHTQGLDTLAEALEFVAQTPLNRFEHVLRRSLLDTVLGFKEAITR